LADILPVNVNPQNPVDISTQVQRDRPKAWEQTIQCITADDGIDFVLNG
jgi:acyl-CoA synthetase (NDP forming)